MVAEKTPPVGPSSEAALGEQAWRRSVRFCLLAGTIGKAHSSLGLFGDCVHNGRGCCDRHCAVDCCDLYCELNRTDLAGYPSRTFRVRRDRGGRLQSVRRGAPIPGLSGEGAFAERHCGSMAAAVFGWLIPQHAALPLAAFTCAASGLLLLRVQIPFVGFAGTALPLLIAWALFGPLISGWQFPWLVWLGLTISCKALREIVRLFERLFIEDFA